MLPLFAQRNRNSLGGLCTTLRSADIAASHLMGAGKNGWAFDTDGYSYITEGTVATTAVRFQGLAFTPDGALYVTYATPPATGDYFVGGIRVSASGAVYAKAGLSSPTTDQVAAGLRLTAAGQLYLDGPWAVSGMTEYWDGQVGITVTGSGVSAWTPVVGSHSFAQSTDANRPTRPGSGALRTNGTSQYMDAGAFTLNQPVVWFVAVKFIVQGNDKYIIDGDASSSCGLRSLTGQVGAISTGTGFAANASLADGLVHILYGQMNGASSIIGIDGAETTGTIGSANPSGVTFGTDGGQAAFFNGDYFGLGYATGAITQAARQQIWQAMRRRYGAV